MASTPGTHGAERQPPDRQGDRNRRCETGPDRDEDPAHHGRAGAGRRLNQVFAGPQAQCRSLLQASPSWTGGRRALLDRWKWAAGAGEPSVMGQGQRWAGRSTSGHRARTPRSHLRHGYAGIPLRVMRSGRMVLVPGSRYQAVGVVDGKPGGQRDSALGAIRRRQPRQPSQRRGVRSRPQHHLLVSDGAGAAADCCTAGGFRLDVPGAAAQVKHARSVLQSSTGAALNPRSSLGQADMHGRATEARLGIGSRGPRGVRPQAEQGPGDDADAELSTAITCPAFGPPDTRPGLPGLDQGAVRYWIPWGPADG